MPTGLLVIIPCAAYLVIESEKVYSDLESKKYSELVRTEIQDTKHKLWKVANWNFDDRMFFKRCPIIDDLDPFDSTLCYSPVTKTFLSKLWF